MRMKSATFVSVLVVAGIWAAPGRGADVPDATCPGPAETQASFEGVARLGQTFTAVGSGPLVAVEIAIHEEVGGADYRITLNATNASGLPTDGVLSTTVVPDAQVPAGDSVVLARFASPTVVTAGKRYAIVVTRPGATSVGVGARGGNDCATGSFTVSSGQTGPFEDFGPTPNDLDVVFTTFLADQDPPETTISKKPPDESGRNKVKYKFASDEEGSSFDCKLDKKPFKACVSPFKKKLDEGRHKFKVRATDEAGNADPTPAKDKFRIEG